MTEKELKVDKVKYPKLDDKELDIHKDGKNLSVVHMPSGISVQADSRATVEENWELAQLAISSALEYKHGSEPADVRTYG